MAFENRYFKKQIIENRFFGGVIYCMNLYFTFKKCLCALLLVRI